ncbi:ketoacyl-ACP synthase III [Pediococcus acidilactici]|jgi:3-oxoacyl-[acyl-carrier-protein] synthase-3|uniref:beta-ketoacyl-ACP synthase III n=1 Tax=Pediococcus acidilactici TaxID=1254 RepID=UPI0006B5F4AE|nr:beta-ketoacyl-ACP synthase III [Pediococcus acidilactici]KAF0373583.1 beta-ketoacyl-ACP synthase III [Pediococcus acidilactici]KAF0384105.1 beta-ketoacyl-ACP synthase III [Pediococcus acidilactici]KAF0458036.1 beta-ketoacyl-ACP synthase III [Pediococcus acidilactici]KAF0477459.1 beta-ketoacyl-ACP synthase III [Pediococcus acidilactici]KAF0537951.1 beta-ketoacyl-ACP synthase III [Pediococcus acidilactici]
MGLKIIDSAKYSPERIITNDELAQTLDTSDEWISKRTGIKQRHRIDEVTNAVMATRVAEDLLAKTNTAPEEVDLIVVATMSPDYQTPSVAAQVQGALKASRAMAFDISAACSGFVYGMSVVNQMLQSPNYHKALLIGSEALSRLLDWQDRSTAVLFGDSAAGVLVENDPASSASLIAERLTTYGDLGEYLTAGNVAALTDSTQSYFFQMNGRKVYEFATNRVPESIQAVLQAAEIDARDVKYFLLHQANARIIKSVAKRLELPIEKFPINIADYGNTAAASEPLLLAELMQEHKIQRGDIIVFSGFGGGLTIGTNVIKF